MAQGYTTSLLLNAQAKLAKRFETPEFRHESYNLIKAMLMQGQNMFIEAELDSLKTSDSRVVESFVFAKRSVTTGSSRSHTHGAAAFGDSQKVTLSFSIVSGTYSVSLKMGGRNIFERSEMLASDLMSASIAINNTIEAAVATYLSANKTQSNAADGNYAEFGEWDDIEKAWKIPDTKRDYMYQYISQVMGINDYSGNLLLIADPVAAAIAAQLAQQGQANATNLGWQFDNMQIVSSRRVADASFLGTVYAIPFGTVGMVDRIPRENKEGFTGKNSDYRSMPDPLGTPLDMATHYREVLADNSSKGSETQDTTFEYENSTDYALVKAPLSSAATDSTIFKFVLESTEV